MYIQQYYHPISSLIGAFVRERLSSTGIHLYNYSSSYWRTIDIVVAVTREL